MADTQADRHWRWWIVLLWLAAGACMLWYKWHAVSWFSLGDTDDNMRFLQVRDWLHGQAWSDLRQHRMDPPVGASIHWSRLVDLPIAALVLLTRPWIGEHDAWYVAVAAAPLLPLLVALFGAGVATRRLVSAEMAPLGAGLLLCGQSALFMFMPLRIDHHNWQLACLIWAVAGLADPKRARGGVTVGLACAVSTTIGLELIPYTAMAGGVTALRWVWDRADARRLIGYGAALAAGCTAGFLGFASNDNQFAVCDALSPVWLSVAAGGGGLLVLAGLLPVGSRVGRLGVAVAAAALVAAFYVLAWPKCVGMLEGMSPELKQLWFSHVKEARPLYTHPWRIGLAVIALPVAGLVGSTMAAWRERHSPRFAPWAADALFTLFAVAMLLWQTRAGPAAQVLAVPGAAWLAWTFVPRILASPVMPVRVLGSVAAFMLFSGLWVFPVENLIPEAPHKPRPKTAAPDVSGRCPTLPAMAQIERLPPATILTMVDLAPRMIAVTHHSAIAGPYHRNGAAILDVHHAFRGSPDVAHEVVRRHGATLVLICPGMPETTIYRAEAPRGFYVQLEHGRVPNWLAPVTLPKNSPFKLWRVVS